MTDENAASLVFKPDVPAAEVSDSKLTVVVVATSGIDALLPVLNSIEGGLIGAGLSYTILVTPVERVRLTPADLTRIHSAAPGCEVVSSCCHWGDAVRLALHRTQSDKIAVLGDDWPLPAEAWSEALALAERAEVVSVEAPAPVASGFRGLCQTGEQVLTRILLGRNAAAGGCAVKVFQRDAVPHQPLQSNSRFVRTELMIATAERGASVVHLRPSSCEVGGQMGEFSLRGCLPVICDLLRFWWRQQQFCVGCSQIPSEVRTQIRDVAILCAAAMVLMLPRLNTPLLEPDEGRHAEIAREMWLTGDFIAPQFLGKAYLDKPPMLYWLCAVSFRLFGVHDWSARLVPCGAAMVTVLATYWLGSSLIGRRGAQLGSLTLLLSLGFITCARFLILESVLTMYVVLALLCGSLATHTGRWRWSWWIAAAISTGLGLLTKGPVAIVLVAPPLAAYHWLGRVGEPGFWRRWLVFGAVAGGIAVPWYVAVILQRPEFFEYFFWKHNLDRFLSGTNHRHFLLFYVPVVLIGLLPWTLALFPAVRFTLIRDASLHSLRPEGLGFLLLWAVWCLGFFTAAAGKLPYYILSCFPALALLTGHHLDRISPFFSPHAESFEVGRQKLWRLGSLLSLAGLITTLVLWGMGFVTPIAVAVWLAVWVALIAVQRWGPFVRSPRRAWATYCLVALLSVAELTQYGLGGWQEEHAILPRDKVLMAKLQDPHTQLFCIGAHWGSVPFYLNRDDIVCLEQGDLEQLSAALSPQREAVLLIEFKIPDDIVEHALTDGSRLELLGTTRRVRYTRIVRD
ncbi:MAG: glycosyltransferase family 39 protein [Planctomycetaceae bacterium]|nr:glycosyltransferase family 39 protein [Planctomycetaceae bacterium]